MPVEYSVNSGWFERFLTRGETEKKHDINTLLRAELAGTRIANPHSSLSHDTLVELDQQEVSLSN